MLGLGPIGQMCCRIARIRGAERVIGVDRIAERLEMARRHGAEVLSVDEHETIGDAVRELTDGRGPDSVIDAVGIEAHHAGGAKFLQTLVGLLPDAVAAPMAEKMGVDRLSALYAAIDTVRRGGTIAIIGLYGGNADLLPMFELFDKGIRIGGMGQAHVKRWVDDLMPLISDDGDPLALDDFVTHVVPLDAAPRAYEMFQKKEDGAIKVVLKP